MLSLGLEAVKRVLVVLGVRRRPRRASGRRERATAVASSCCKMLAVAVASSSCRQHLLSCSRCCTPEEPALRRCTTVRYPVRIPYTVARYCGQTATVAQPSVDTPKASTTIQHRPNLRPQFHAHITVDCLRPRLTSSPR